MDNKKEDEIYCPECGKPIKRKAVVCIYCGVQVQELKASNKREDKRVEVSAKSKTTATMLSIFFSFWSWLYTYKKNYKKFWIGFGVVSTIITIIALLVISFSSELFIIYGTWVWLLWLTCGGGIWIWALVDNSGKPDSFYENYPNS